VATIPEVRKALEDTGEKVSSAWSALLESLETSYLSAAHPPPGGGGAYQDVRLESLDHAPARAKVQGTISRVEKLAQHSHATGRYGWEGEEVWVADGLRGTFRVHFAP